MAAKRPTPKNVRDDIERRMRKLIANGTVSQSELSRRTGVGQSVISMSCTGYRRINRVDTLQRLDDELVKLERKAGRAA